MKQLLIVSIALASFASFAEVLNHKPLVMSCSIEAQLTIINGNSSIYEVFVDPVSVGATKQIALGKLKDQICLEIFNNKACEKQSYGTVIKTPTVNHYIRGPGNKVHNRKAVSSLVKKLAECETQREN